VQGVYRESNQAEVFQVAMLWASLRSELSEVMTGAKLEDLHARFCRGVFDRDLAMQVKLKNADFKYTDLPFLQSHDQQLEESKTVAQTAPEHALRLLQIKLQSEQAKWQMHKAAVHSWTHKTFKARIDFEEKKHTLRVAAVDAHSNSCFGVAVVSDVSKAPQQHKIYPRSYCKLLALS